MKSLQDLYTEIIENDDLKSEFLEAVEQGEQQTLDFVNSHGCDVTLDEMKAFADGFEAASEEELSEDELENVAGGSSKGKKVGLFVLSFAGVVGCVAYAIVSACVDTDAPKDDFQKQSDYRDKNAPKGKTC